MLDIVQPIFDPDFHLSSYGYRPGRSCQTAVAKAAMFMRQYDRRWVVGMDLSKCFDRLDHGLIIASISKRVRDGSIWKLIEMFLKAVVMIDHDVELTELGSPQGGVISPLIANIYLDAFMENVKAITRHSSPVNLAQVIQDLNPVLRGFVNYFRMPNCKELFRDPSAWIRRRLRQKQLSDWKKPSRLHRRLRQLGYQGEFPKIRMRSWRSARSPQASIAIPNAWLADLGLFDLASVEARVLPKFTLALPKHEPYTDPYVRFCERAESGLIVAIPPTRHNDASVRIL